MVQSPIHHEGVHDEDQPGDDLVAPDWRMLMVMPAGSTIPVIMIVVVMMMVMIVIMIVRAEEGGDLHTKVGFSVRVTCSHWHLGRRRWALSVHGSTVAAIPSVFHPWVAG